MQKSGDLTQDGDPIRCEMSHPAYPPCGYIVEIHRWSRPAATDIEEELLRPESDSIGPQTPTTETQKRRPRYKRFPTE